MYLTVQEVAAALNKSSRQVRYMVEQGSAYPVNPDTYRRDGGYRFTQQELERLKGIYITPHLSLSEAAKLIGISPQYLNTLALEGKVSSQLVQVGNRDERRFEREECVRFKQEIEQQTHTRRNKYGKRLIPFKNGIRLFSIVERQGQPVRVINTNPLLLLNQDGLITKNGMTANHRVPWPEIPYVYKKGFVEFKIPIPRHMDHQTYDTLYKMIEQLGVKNIQIYERNTGDYFIRCRQGQFIGNADDYELLSMYIRTGKVRLKEQYILLETAYISKTIQFPEELLKTLEHQAQQANTHLQEYILFLLKQACEKNRKE